MKKILLILLFFMCFSLMSCNTEKVEKYDIYFETSGVGVSPETIDDVVFIPYSLPTVEAEGYDFLGWYLDESCEQKVVMGIKINSDITLYAKWSVVISGSFDTPVIPGN